ncbi:MAG: hypothetical protein ABIQ93_01595 [Saprospiraceae bacterium]
MKLSTLFLLISCYFGQQDGKIYFQNPSFEDTPRQSASPAGWESLTDGSTPDILPGAWGVKSPPQQGKTCLGLVTRTDGTREDVSQLLEQTLKGNTCYTFSIYLAHAPAYVGYNQPLQLRVWGGATRGAKSVLLYSSPLIDHTAWKKYDIEFMVASDVRYITFEAYFGPGVLFYYKGNILLDNCSPIERCDRA